jgi:hypothetical protein
MDEASLVADLKASLQDAAEVFTAADDADFKRHLAHAAADFGRRFPRRVRGSVTVEADKAEYPAPAGMLRPLRAAWSDTARRNYRPWDRGWPEPDPRLSLEADDTGARVLVLSPPPSQAQITQLGATFPFVYEAGHQIGTQAADTTISDARRGLLLLRAQAEAMKELAARNLKKPVQLRDGQGGAPRNGVPAALHQQLMDEFERLAA